MVSTYLGYELYANNFAKSLQRIGNEPNVKDAQTYYDANIGKVKNVDELINNYRLFSYAMESFGLKEMTYAKGLMRRVLTSDLSDPRSVANKLSDSRYLAFAKAFSFTTSGAVTPVSIQSASAQSSTISRFQTNTATTLDAATASKATAYYQQHIGVVSSLTQLTHDPKLYSYVLAAYGIDPGTPMTSVTALLESALSDPASALGQTKGAGYTALQQAVNVTSTGAAAVAMPAQSTDVIASTVSAYQAAAKTDSASQTGAAAETAYYRSTIGTITSASALVGDGRLVNYVLQAFGLPASTPAATVQQILTSDPADPTSFASRSGIPEYGALASAFNFTSTGALRSEPFQNADQQRTTESLYTARQTSDSAAVDTATQYYKANIGAVTSVSSLEHDPKLLSYVLTAYGIDAATSSATLENVLEDSLSDSHSAINTTPGSNALAFATAFQVDASGNAVLGPQAQNGSDTAAATAAYAATAGTDAASKSAAAKETAYYQAAIARTTSVGDLLSDKRVVSYVVRAFGLPATTSTDQLRQALTGNVSKTGSIDSQNKLKTLASSFNFDRTGLIARQPPRAQSRATQAAAAVSYNRQTMEDEAGDTNTGVKLALYFQRMAPTITNAYGLLADKALLQVCQTLFRLPATSAQADVDGQARSIKSKLNIADLKDPKYVDQLVKRFSILYDLDNNTNATSSPVSLLFGSQSG